METDMTATDAYLAHETRLGHSFILKDGEWPKAEAGTRRGSRMERINMRQASKVMIACKSFQ